MKQFEELDKRMALLEQKLDLVLENHLAHMEKDIALIKKVMLAVGIAVVVEAAIIIMKMGA